MWGRRLRLSSFRTCLSTSIWICILIASVSSAWAKERSGQDPSTKGVVRFELYQGYLMVARGSIGPLKGLHFLVDTGTSTTLLDSQVANKLGLEGKSEDVNIIFFKGRVQSTHSWAPSIELGPLRVFHRPVLVQDLSVFGDAVPVHIDAVIGLDVLGRSPFEVDYRNSKIYFGRLPHFPISASLTKEQGLAMVNVEVNHATAHLIFDTGASSLLIFGSRIPKVFAGLKTHRRGRNASSEQNEVHLRSLHLGQTEFAWQQAILMESRDEGGREFDGVLSPAALHIDAFTFDLVRGALELKLGM